MKKKVFSLFLVLCLLVAVCPIAVAADYPDGSYYEAYTAIGDSICAGFSQPDYDYSSMYDVREGAENPPALCYASLVANKMGSDIFNLGKCGSDTEDLVAMLTDPSNEYYSAYQSYIGSSDLITLEIGSNDLLFDVLRAVMSCLDPSYANLTNEQLMALAEPIFTGDFSPDSIEAIIAEMEATFGDITPEQAAAIAATLSDESLTAILEASYAQFLADFPLAVQALRSISPNAELVILNYYNPYGKVNFSYNGVDYHIGAVLQVFIDRMNSYTRSYSQQNGYVYVDISRTTTNGADPHPSTAGHAKIASKIIDALLSTVTSSAGEGGSINPAGETTVKRGDSLTFTVTPDEGNMISSVSLDGAELDSTGLTALPDGSYTYELSDITADHTVSAAFQASADPVLTADDTDLDFGSVVEDYTAPAAQTVTLTNDGVQKVFLTLPTSRMYDIGLDDTVLAPGESTTLTVQPKAGLTAGDYSGALELQAAGDYGSGTVTVSVAVSFKVAAHTYILAATPSNLDFGSADEDYKAAPAAQSVTIRNDGNTAITLTAPTSANYTLTLGDTQLDPGETTTLTVQPKAGLPLADYSETVVLKGTNGAVTAVSIKFTVGEAYKYTVLTDAPTGVVVAGYMKSTAKLVVGALSLGTDAGSNSIRTMQGKANYTQLAGFNIQLTGDFTGSLTVKIPVGAKYNGQTVTILQAASTGLKTYTAVVKDGAVTVTVTGFSPFAVFAKTDNAPETGDAASVLLWLLAATSVAGVGTLATAAGILRRKKD